MGQNKTTYNNNILELSSKLLIDVEDLSAGTLVDLNIDPVKLVPYILEAQKLKLEPVIGTSLYRALQSPDRTWEYDYLVNNYVKDAMLHWALSDYLTVAPYSVANGGVFKHLPEDAETVSNTEVNTMTQRERYKAQEFGQRLVNFLDTYMSTYPEYTQCISDGLRSKRRIHHTGGWVVGTSSNCGTGCSFDPTLFVTNTWFGSNNEVNMGFDLSGLTQSSTIPNEVFAQPTAQYYWIVTEKLIAISQNEMEIPLGDINAPVVLENAFVTGTQDGKFWIRTVSLETYESIVEYNLNIK